MPAVTATGPADPSKGFGENLTDTGNAKRFVARHGSDVRYCTPWRKWLVWDSRRWRIDDTGEVHRRMKESLASIYAEASVETSDSRRAQVANHARMSESEARLRAALVLAQSEACIPILPDQLDAHHLLFNVENGTIQLDSGTIRRHRREDYLTRLAPCEYDDRSSRTLWMRFLRTILANDVSLMHFVQRAVGYSMTGKLSERVLFILHGAGANGKTTFLETLRHVFGDYAMRTPTATLMTKRPGAIPNDIARLRGGRFVTAAENEQDEAFAAAVIKDLTGGDKITARFLHAEFFEFTPTGKIWLATNHRPFIRDTSPAIWDRLRLIPFEVRIEAKDRDPNLLEKLAKEAPGILAWAVRGCVKWYAAGLGSSTKVIAATAGYQADMDTVANFLEDRCKVKRGSQAWRVDLYKAFKEYVTGVGDYPLGPKAFYAALREKGFSEKRSTGGQIRVLGVEIQGVSIPLS